MSDTEISHPLEGLTRQEAELCSKITRGAFYVCGAICWVIGLATGCLLPR